MILADGEIFCPGLKPSNVFGKLLNIRKLGNCGRDTEDKHVILLTIEYWNQLNAVKLIMAFDRGRLFGKYCYSKSIQR